MDNKYKLNLDTVVYTTDVFTADVGPYPGEELDLYRVYNKTTGVMEYAHSILFYAQQWMDMATQIIKQGEIPSELTGEIALPGQ